MNRQRGYTLLETLVSVGIVAVASVVVAMAIYQVFTGTQENNDHMNTVHQVQNAGYWISRDTQMAVSINATANLTFPRFLQFGWTEWDDEGSAVYHLSEYTLEDGSDDAYNLVRSHTSTNGTSGRLIVARSIFYDPGESYSSTSVYDDPVLEVDLTALYRGFRETREFRILRRPGT